MLHNHASRSHLSFSQAPEPKCLDLTRVLLSFLWLTESYIRCRFGSCFPTLAPQNLPLCNLNVDVKSQLSILHLITFVCCCECLPELRRRLAPHNPLTIHIYYYVLYECWTGKLEAVLCARISRGVGTIVNIR